MTTHSYKTLFPYPCGAFTAQEIRDLPHNGFDKALKAKLHELFYTAKEVAFILECSLPTARKKLESVTAMTMGEPHIPFQRIYYLATEADILLTKLTSKKDETESV